MSIWRAGGEYQQLDHKATLDIRDINWRGNKETAFFVKSLQKTTKKMFHHMKWTQGHWLRNKCSHGLRGILQSVKKYLVKTWESRTTIHGKMRTLITITTRLISTAHVFRHPRVALPKWMCVAGRIFLDKHFRVKRKYLLLFILNKKNRNFFAKNLYIRLLKT